uniref:Uncharacterized protein n=1 Tax=Glossina austeni TaxID=7395 RepID=A0A1A9UMN9_GLOAU
MSTLLGANTDAVASTTAQGATCAGIDESTGICAGACSDAYADVKDAVNEELMPVLTLVRTYIFTFVVTKLGLMLMLIFKLMPRLVLTRAPLLVALTFVLQQFPSELIHNSLASIEVSVILAEPFRNQANQIRITIDTMNVLKRRCNIKLKRRHKRLKILRHKFAHFVMICVKFHMNVSYVPTCPGVRINRS